MSHLSRKQRSHLWGLLAVTVMLSFFAGIGYAIYWSAETTSVQHFCSGTTGFTVSDTNGDGTSVAWTVNDPGCR